MSLLEQGLRPRKRESLRKVGGALAALALVEGIVTMANPVTRQGVTDRVMDALIGRPVGWQRDPNGPVMVLSVESDTAALLQCAGNELPANLPSSIPRGCLVWEVDYANELVAGDVKTILVTPGSEGEIFTQEQAGVPQE